MLVTSREPLLLLISGAEGSMPVLCKIVGTTGKSVRNKKKDPIRGTTSEQDKCSHIHGVQHKNTTENLRFRHCESNSGVRYISGLRSRRAEAASIQGCPASLMHRATHQKVAHVQMLAGVDKSQAQPLKAV